jgi:methylenetetrahydrofolate reductase (NADPH)
MLLFSKLKSMSNMNPVWVDVTFGANGSTTENTLAICDEALNKYNVDVMMHLTCTNMTITDLDHVLERMQERGIRNILALRGDPPKQSNEWTQCEGGFSHAVDLVRYIRLKYDNFFCIGVAGYPEGHTDSESLEKDMQYLKQKVDAGADLIVTQLFYDTDKFLSFVEKARTMGIDCPIIPGIMPITTFAGFMRMTTMCKTFVPEGILDALTRVKDDDVKVRNLGITLAVDMCTEIIRSGKAEGIHLYTMNNEDNIREIVRRLSPILPPIHSEWDTK